MNRPWVDAPETELVVAAAGGDHDAFAVLHDRLASRVYSRFLCEFGDEAAAQDATQDTFVEAWRALPDLREPRALRAWVATIANRRAMRSNGDRALQVDPFTRGDALAGHPDPSPEPDQRAMQAEARQLVADALQSLNPRYRMALDFVLTHGRAGRDLGTVLGVDAAQASRVADKATHSLGDAIRALLVARSGRSGCADLDRILTEAGWTTGPLSEDLRTSVQRHIGRCGSCQPRRQAAARTVIESLPVVLPLLVPAALRERILSEARRIASLRPAPPLPPGGHAPPPAPGKPRPVAILTVVGLVLLILGAWALATRNDDPGEALARTDATDETQQPGVDEPDTDRDLPADAPTTLPSQEDAEELEGIPPCTEWPGTSVEGDKLCHDAAGQVYGAVGYWQCPQGLLFNTSTADGIAYWGFEGDVWHAQEGPVDGCPE